MVQNNDDVVMERDTDIEVLIKEQDWDRVYEIFLTEPSQAKLKVDSSRGWTMLHLLCSLGSTPTALIELTASIDPQSILQPDERYGDTPLHMLCRNSVMSATKVRSVLKILGNDTSGLLIRNRFGGTVLHSAANHNAVLEVLQELVNANPLIAKVTTFDGIYPVSALWHSYLQTIPGYMTVARILEGETALVGESTHFGRFWKKLEYLATASFMQTPFALIDIQNREIYARSFFIHGLLRCNVQVNAFKVALRISPKSLQVADANGNLPLHVLAECRPFRLKEKEALEDAICCYQEAAAVPNNNGDYPLWIAIYNKIPWDKGLDLILQAAPHIISLRERKTGLFAFQLAAVHSSKYSLDTIYRLLSTQPDLLIR